MKNQVVLSGVQGLTIMAVLADRIADADAVLDEFAGKTADATAAREKAEQERDAARKAETMAADARRKRVRELEDGWDNALSRLAVAEQEREEAYVANGKLQGNLAATEQIAANLREERRVLAEAVAWAVRVFDNKYGSHLVKLCGEPDVSAMKIVAQIRNSAGEVAAAPLIEGCLQHRKREALQ